LKGPKNNGVFTNFYYGSHRDDFYILISARPLKAGSNKFNASEKVILKPGPHKLKDRHRSIVLEEITIGNNGFKDLSSWESIEKGPRIPEDRLCKLVESQEMTIGPDEAFIGGLDLETSRRTTKKRPYILAKLRDEVEMDNTCRNPKGYNILLQLTSF